MTDDLDQLRERVRQNREALSDNLSREASSTPPRADGTPRTPEPGDRVLDRITGQEGVIEYGAPGNTDGADVFAVRLPGGGLLLRPLAQLLLRPARPAAE